MIRRYDLGFDKMPLRFAAATMFVVGCSATAQDPDPPTPGGGAGPGGAGSSGISGSAPIAGQATFGGSGSNPGSAGRASGGASGGSAGRAGTAGSGGAPGVSGAAATAGAAPVGGSAPVAGAPSSGSGGASSCDTYSGTVKTASTIFTSGFGKASMGTWQGYAYTFKFGTATVTPGSSTSMSCFPGMQMCAAGNVPADDDSGAGIGWSINQAMGTTTVGAAAITTPVKIQFKGGAVGMRVGLVPVPAAAMEFCYTLTAADVTAASGTGGLTLPLTSFKQACYDTATAVAYAGEMIKAIQVSVPGSKSGTAKMFDFCLIDIEPG